MNPLNGAYTPSSLAARWIKSIIMKNFLRPVRPGSEGYPNPGIFISPTPADLPSTRYYYVTATHTILLETIVGRGVFWKVQIFG